MGTRLDNSSELLSQTQRTSTRGLGNINAVRGEILLNFVGCPQEENAYTVNLRTEEGA